MAESHALATELLGKFMGVAIEETPMSLNQEANEMAGPGSQTARENLSKTHYSSKRNDHWPQFMIERSQLWKSCELILMSQI